MEQSLQTTSTSRLPTVPPKGSWGAEKSSAADLIIPKILIMQGQSKFVTDEKIQARQGELRDSLQGKLLAKPGEPIRFIPFYLYNTWIDFEKRNGKFEFVGMYERNTANEDLEWEFTKDGKEMKRTKAINAYVLLEKELGGVFLPYVLSFSSTSFKIGKKFVTLVEMLKQFDLAPAHKVFELSTHKASNDKGTWFAPDVEQVADTSDEHLAIAYNWYLRVVKGGVKVDTSDMSDDVTPTQEMPTNF